MSRYLINELEREADHGDEMAAMARYWMHRALEAEKQVWRTKAWLVAAAGGEITIYPAQREKMEGLAVEQIYQPWDMSFRLRIRDSDSQPSRQSRNSD